MDSGGYTLQIVVYGAGGVGGTIGARLFLAGADVSLIARGAHGRAIRANGLRFVAPDGDWRLRIPVVDHPAQRAWRGDEVVILSMKSQQTEAALADLADVAPGVTVVCAQNGVANERAAAARFEHVLAMVVWLPGVHLEAGVVVTHAAGCGGVLDCGRYPEGHSEQAVALAGLLEQAGFSCRADARPLRWKYAKLLANLGNGVDALCGPVPAADVLRALRREALACYAAAGISCASRDEVQKRHRDTYRMVDIPGFPRGGGSTWQSLSRGTGNVETDYLNGEIVALGREHGVATPVNAAMQAAVAQALADGDAAGSWTVDRLEGFLAAYAG